MNNGYQPDKGHLQSENPPKGMTELERAKKWFNDLDYSDRLELIEMYVDPDDLRGEIGDFYKYMDNDLKLEMYRENFELYKN